MPLDLKGVRVHVRYSRPPGLVLDVSALGIWRCSILLAAMQFGRKQGGVRAGVVPDRYGIWTASGIPVTASKKIVQVPDHYILAFDRSHPHQSLVDQFWRFLLFLVGSEQDFRQLQRSVSEVQPCSWAIPPSFTPEWEPSEDFWFDDSMISINPHQNYYLLCSGRCAGVRTANPDIFALAVASGVRSIHFQARA